MKAWPVLVLTMLCILSTGCVVQPPPPLPAEGVVVVPLAAVKEAPQAHRGLLVLWGGSIASALNTREGTLLEVVEHPLGGDQRPLEVDASQGRFLALFPDYLDTAIYAQGREVTVLGTIDGLRTQLLGMIDYTYPVLQVREIHLWPKRPRVQVIYRDPYYSPYWYWGPAWWGWGGGWGYHRW